MRNSSLLLFLLALPAALRAANGVNGVCAINPGGAIIAAHETDGDPDTNFHRIVGEAVGTPGLAGTYRAVFSLKDASGASVQLDDGAGNAVNSLVSASAVMLTNTGTLTLRLGFLPVNALDPQARYRVAATVQRQTGPTTWTNVGAANGPLQSFFYFTGAASDAPLNAYATVSSLTLQKPVIVRTVAGEEDFTVTGTVQVTRYDDPDVPPAAATVPLTFTLSMESTDAVPVPVALATTTVQVEVPVESYDGDGAAVASAPFTLHFAPADWSDLLPTKGYRLKASLAQEEPDMSVTTHFTDRLVTSSTDRLFALSGDLYFSNVRTAFTQVTNDPAAGGVTIPNNTLETSLTIPAGNGALHANGTTTRRFGGAPMDVWIEPGATGQVAFFRGLGQVPFSTVDTDLETLAGVRVIRTTMKLNQNGLVADGFGVFFPDGFGYTLTAGGRRLKGYHQFTNLPCGPDLLPLDGVLAITGPGTVHCVHDALPVKFAAAQITWDRIAGTFTIPSGSVATYVRSAEDATFAAGSKPMSNDAYFRAARDLTADAVIIADANGRAQVQSATLAFTDGTFRSHFPQQAEIAWSGGGQLVIENGRVTVAASSLDTPGTLTANYQRGCPKDPCGIPESATVSITPTEASLRFTPDGGLKLNGDLAAPEELRWGRNGAATYAHRTQAFAATRFHMPGNVLRALENNRALPAGAEPAALLLAGMGATGDESLTERPGTPPVGDPDTYHQGNADYAGLNFRRTTQGAWSRLGGGDVGTPAAPYPLHAAAKYYARFGGVSGRHQAVRPAPGAPGAFSSVFLYGFKCSLSGIALGYLDSENVFSAVGGGIHVPGDIPGLNGNPAPPPGMIIEPLPPGMTRGPSGFDQGFAALTFHCDGRPNKAELDGTAPHFLEYWNVWFQPLTFAFTSKVDGVGCPLPGQGALALGASVFIPSITSVKPQATFTFKNNGNLVTRAEAPAYQVQDALLTVPSEIPVNGPGNVPYKLTTRGKAYLNNPAAPGAPTGAGEGWINLYGGLDVPFFRDTKVHLHIANPSAPGTPAVANPNAATWIMGGWASHDALPSPHAWTEAASPPRTPFNHDAFDANQYGFEGPLAAYREPAPAADRNATRYLPRAQQEWLEVFRMDYAMRFNSTTRAFTGEGEPEGDLLVIKARHRLLNLNSSIAEITFGAKYEGLPVLNVTKVLSDAATGAVDGAVSALASAGMNATGLTDAVNSFDRLLATGLSDLIEAKLGAAIDSVTAGIPVSTIQTWNVAPPDVAGWTSAIRGLADAPTGAINTAGGFVQEMDARLAHVDGGLGAILAFLPSDAQIAAGQGPIRTLTVTMLNQAIGGNPIGDAIAANLGDVIAQGIEPELKRAGPALAEVRSSVLKVRAAVQQARDSLQSGSGLLREINAALTMGATFENTVRNELQAWVAMTPGTLAERGDVWVRAEIRRLVLRRFYADSGAAKLQGALRYHFTSVRQAFRGALDGLLGEVNRTIRDGVYKALNSLEADLGLDKFSAGLGQVSSSFGAAAIEGYARIAGDSIDKLRIDAKLKLRAADDFEFKGWLEVNALNAKSPRAKCYCANPNEMRDGAEIIIGGEAPLTFMSEGSGQDEDNARIRVQGMFAFGACGLPGTPISLLGLGGQIEMTGSINVAGVTIQQIGFIFSFGKASNYFGAKARASFKGYEFAAALFVGSTCGAEPLRFVDPSIAKLLTHPKVGVLKTEAEIDTTLITGFYVYAEAWIPLNEIFGIPTTCLFSVRAGVGAGPFVFAIDTPGPQSQLMVGSKQFLGFDVDLLCIASATAEVKLTGAITIPFNDPVDSDLAVLEDKPAGENYGGSAEGLALRLLGEASFTVEICLLVCFEFTKDFDFYAQVGGNDTSFGFGH